MIRWLLGVAGLIAVAGSGAALAQSFVANSEAPTIEVQQAELEAKARLDILVTQLNRLEGLPFEQFAQQVRALVLSNGALSSAGVSAMMGYIEALRAADQALNAAALGDAFNAVMTDIRSGGAQTANSAENSVLFASPLDGFGVGSLESQQPTAATPQGQTVPEVPAIAAALVTADGTVPSGSEAGSQTLQGASPSGVSNFAVGSSPDGRTASRTPHSPVR